MPVLKCPNGKFRVGSGPCQYNSRADAEAAYKGYLGTKFSKVKIEGNFQEMAAEDIRSLIDDATYNAIKAKDEHPTFAALSLGHEGESTGNTILKKGEKILGSVKLVKKWLKENIERLTDKLKIGTKILHLHKNDDNSTADRTPLGELVGKGLKKIDDILHSMGIIYYYPEHAKNDFDIASIEGAMDFDMRRAGDGTLIGDDIKIHDVTAITVANSKTNKPGFAGAKLQGLLQEFADETGGHKMPVTKEEIRQHITDEGLNASDVFTNDQLAADPVVKGLVKEDRSSEYFARIKDKKSAKDNEDKLTKENAELKTKLEASEKAGKKVESKTKLDVLMTERKLTDKQKAWIARDFEKKFTISDLEKIDGELKEFADLSLTDMEESEALLTGKKKNPSPKNVDKDEGDPNLDQDKSKDGKVDYTDPKENPMIPD